MSSNFSPRRPAPEPGRPELCGRGKVAKSFGQNHSKPWSLSAIRSGSESFVSKAWFYPD